MTSSPEVEFLQVKRVEMRPVSPSPGLLVRTDGRGVRPKPQIAHITPTPQVEHGRLSPGLTPRSQQSSVMGVTPRSPRRPLAELDQSQLSQRLFQSPSLTSPASLSPSLLLTSQLPPSVERRHRNTERQLTELKARMTELEVSSGNRNQFSQLKRLALEQERDQLEALLEEKELQLEALKKSVEALNAEYSADVSNAQQDCQALEQELEEKEEKFSKLEIEHKKSLKTIQGLRSYISTLPPVEEVEVLRGKLEEKASALKEVKENNIEVSTSLKEMTSQCKSVSREKLNLEIENKELKERLEELSAKVKNHEKIRLETRSLDETQVELLAFDNDELTLENQRLKNTLSWEKNKFEEEKSKLEEQVRKLGGFMEQTNVRLQETHTELREKNIAYSRLEAELRSKSEAVRTMAEKLDKVGAESSCLRSQSDGTGRLERHYSRLARSMGRCLTELNNLTDLASQVMEGGNPSTSVLLGTRGDLSILIPRESPLNRDSANLTTEEKLELVRQQMAEVGEVQENIKKMRSRIQEEYADRLADNNMSCATQ